MGVASTRADTSWSPLAGTDGEANGSRRFSLCGRTRAYIRVIKAGPPIRFYEKWDISRFGGGYREDGPVSCLYMKKSKVRTTEKEQLHRLRCGCSFGITVLCCYCLPAVFVLLPTAVAMFLHFGTLLFRRSFLYRRSLSFLYPTLFLRIRSIPAGTENSRSCSSDAADDM